MRRIILNNHEMFHAAEAGVRRQTEAIKKHRKHRHGNPRQDHWGINIQSAGAEMAVAKATNTYWNPVVDDPSTLPGDVGNYEVRHTQRMDGRLIVHDSDPDDRPFILVRGTLPTYVLAGWLFGHECKKQHFMHKGDGRPAYFVPADKLKPMCDLPMSGATHGGGNV